MVNLADITRAAGQGGGLDALSRQYGIDPAQTAKVVEALLPAFTLAFQRLVLNPAAFAEFTRGLASGNYASYFDNPGQSQAIISGAAVLEQLFRSPEAAKQVATQVAALTGVGAQAMQQLMPAIAAAIVGGMFRYASVEGFADLLRQWGDALKAASDRLDPPKPQDPWSAWQAATSQMMGFQPAPQPPPPPRTFVPEPGAVLDAWAALVGAMAGVAPSQPPRPAPPREAPTTILPPPRLLEPERPASPDVVTIPITDGGPDTAGPPNGHIGSEPESEQDPNPFEAMSQMFETGREVHAQHVAAFQSILDNVWGPARKP